jgi:preprotein translocase subunit SecE
VSKAETKDIKPAESKTGLNDFVRESRQEIAKITWPTRKEIIQTTIIIVVMALITGVVFFGIDTVLGYAIGHILNMGLTTKQALPQLPIQ